MPRSSRQLDNPLWDKTGLTVLCHKPKAELQQMLSTGEAIYVCRECGRPADTKRCLGKVREHKMVWVATEMFKASRTSRATLTMVDCLANAGVHESKKRIRTAQDKVAAWPIVGDDRAVRVGPALTPEAFDLLMEGRRVVIHQTSFGKIWTEVVV